jgi:vacuolar-type H+-ATPase subunit H
MTKETQDEQIEVKEAVDGSASVALPDSIPNPQSNDSDNDDDEDRDEPKMAEGGEADGDDDHPDDNDALRAVKRDRRRTKKQLVRQTNAEKELKLQMLERQNQDLISRLSVVESKTHSADLARIDKAIEDSELRINYAKMKLSEASESRDGAAMTKAQEMWMEARQQAESLRNLKKSATQPRQESSIPDPRLQRNAADWMERNGWYKPDGKDIDSRIAKQVDETLTAEGWDPTTKDYWEELDNRLQRYVSHRYNANTDESPNQRSKPRGIVTGSGRESASRAGGKNTFTLSPEQVRAMKDAGFWDDSEKRNKMIKRYASEARTTQGYRS